MGSWPILPCMHSFMRPMSGSTSEQRRQTSPAQASMIPKSSSRRSCAVAPAVSMNATAKPAPNRGMKALTEPDRISIPPWCVQHSSPARLTRAGSPPSCSVSARPPRIQVKRRGRRQSRNPTFAPAAPETTRNATASQLKAASGIKVRGCLISVSRGQQPAARQTMTSPAMRPIASPAPFRSEPKRRRASSDGATTIRVRSGLRAPTPRASKPL